MNRRGFTLFELTIVLTIIALIVGGIVVGQELIAQARTRQLLSQIEKYNSAVATFRGKYNAIPGDILADTAASLGFFAETTQAGLVGHQDGNGLVEGGSNGSLLPIGESLEFWRHLSDAQLVDGNFSPDPMIDPATGFLISSLTPATLPTAFPPAKLGRDNYVLIYSPVSPPGRNYFIITGLKAATILGAYTTDPAITPTELGAIDMKTDDGLSNTGNVVALRSSTLALFAGGPGGAGPTACVTSVTNGGAYNISSATYKDNLLCAMRVRSAF